MNTAATVQPDFAARLYDRLARLDAGRNVFLSPFSIEVALAMCAAGAKGTTRTVLADLIGAPASVERQNRHYADWLATLHGAGEHGCQLASANALWGQRGCRVDPEFAQALADFYAGAFRELDFRAKPDDAAKKINAWVESKTSGKIKHLVKRNLITPDTRLILTNAIYFKGKWEDEFEKDATLDEDWHGFGATCKVPMMQQRRDFPYFECADLQAVELPYQGDRLSMLIVLPRKNDGLPALENRWAIANRYEQVTSSLGFSGTVIVSLPRFRIEAEFELKPVLCALGAELAFSDQADFTGIAAEPLKISEVVHKAFIEVNEEGTEAAAATGVAMAKCAAMPSQPILFQADHPFLFLIRDRIANAVLFCGRVLDPS